MSPASWLVLGWLAAAPAPSSPVSTPSSDRSFLDAAPAAGAASAAPWAWPLLAVGGLAAAAALAARRRQAQPRRLQVVETHALGPKRSLVLARLGEELLLLGCSEAGVTLLKSQREFAAEAAAVSEPVRFEAALADSLDARELRQTLQEALRAGVAS